MHTTLEPGTFDHAVAVYKQHRAAILPPPVEFIEGSSSGALAVPEEQYEPINATPRPTKTERPRAASPPAQSSKNASLARPNAASASLYPGTIDLTWPATAGSARGLCNSGNTCFLNSAVQCLLHTPPLLRILIDHTEATCPVKQGFCMTCSLRQVAEKSYNSNPSAFSPTPISGKLQYIAKDMREGRQEDSHEFLRYAIDAMRKSCLAGQPPKIDPKLAETTWVHKIFGGRLRSRVHGRDCGHNSDTFDSFLDLSLDIHNLKGVRAALAKFTAIDTLSGANKYKCEKCKKLVIAEKRFSVHEAPMVLTVHLKRFTPMGRKLKHLIKYEERLSLKPYMSDGNHGPNYSLYGVICHAGSGPNSGHYYAFVKSGSGQWTEMNDEMVTNVQTPTDLENAYILFYLREKGQALDAIRQTSAPERPDVKGSAPPPPPIRLSSPAASQPLGIRLSSPAASPAASQPLGIRPSKPAVALLNPVDVTERRWIQRFRPTNMRSVAKEPLQMKRLVGQSVAPPEDLCLQQGCCDLRLTTPAGIGPVLPLCSADRRPVSGRLRAVMAPLSEVPSLVRILASRMGAQKQRLKAEACEARAEGDDCGQAWQYEFGNVCSGHAIKVKDGFRVNNQNGMSFLDWAKRFIANHATNVAAQAEHQAEHAELLARDASCKGCGSALSASGEDSSLDLHPFEDRYLLFCKGACKYRAWRQRQGVRWWFEGRVGFANKEDSHRYRECPQEAVLVDLLSFLLRDYWLHDHIADAYVTSFQFVAASFRQVADHTHAAKGKPQVLRLLSDQGNRAIEPWRYIRDLVRKAFGLAPGQLEDATHVKVMETIFLRLLLPEASVDADVAKVANRVFPHASTQGKWGYVLHAEGATSRTRDRISKDGLERFFATNVGKEWRKVPPRRWPKTVHRALSRVFNELVGIPSGFAAHHCHETGQFLGTVPILFNKRLGACEAICMRDVARLEEQASRQGERVRPADVTEWRLKAVVRLLGRLKIAATTQCPVLASVLAAFNAVPDVTQQVQAAVYQDEGDVVLDGDVLERLPDLVLANAQARAAIEGNILQLDRPYSAQSTTEYRVYRRGHRLVDTPHVHEVVIRSPEAFSTPPELDDLYHDDGGTLTQYGTARPMIPADARGDEI